MYQLRLTNQTGNNITVQGIVVEANNTVYIAAPNAAIGTDGNVRGVITRIRAHAQMNIGTATDLIDIPAGIRAEWGTLTDGGIFRAMLTS